jgi:hypothetical protein
LYAVGAGGVYSNPFVSGGIYGGAGGGEVLWRDAIGLRSEVGVLSGNDTAITFAISGVGKIATGSHANVMVFQAGYMNFAWLTDVGQKNALTLGLGVDHKTSKTKVRVEFVEIIRHHAWTDFYSLARLGLVF